MLEVRRYKDIVAFKSEGQIPWAFHARNMETAEVSTETWDSLPLAEFISDNSKDFLVSNDSTEEVKEWEASENTEVTTNELKFGIRSLTINVTQICNLHCTYCAAGGDGTYGDVVKKISIEKTLPQIKFFLDQLKPDSSFHISFLGGEPLLYPEALKAIAEYTQSEAQRKNISTSFKVTTNGTLLTEKNVEILNSLGIGVIISLDGPSEINDSRRPSKTGLGSTEKVLSGLNTLASNRTNIPFIELHAVMDPGHSDVETTYEFFRTLPVDRFEFTFSVNNSNPDSSKNFVLSFEKAAEKAAAIGGEKELRRFTHLDRYFNILDNQERIENHCGLGKSLAIADARNRLFNCPWTVGDKANQIGDDTTLDYDQIGKYSKSIVEMNNCQNCWARFLCGGGCSFVHGSVKGTGLNKKNDFCFRTRYLSAVALKHYTMIRGNYGEEKGESYGQKETH